MKLRLNYGHLYKFKVSGRRGTAPVFGSEKFLFENQVGLLYQNHQSNLFWFRYPARYNGAVHLTIPCHAFCKGF